PKECASRDALTRNTIMKQLLLLLLALRTLAAHAQGTVAFANLAPGDVVNAPVYMSDRATRLSGPQFMAELLAGPSADALLPITATGFLTGNGAGYFNADVQAISSVAPGSAAWIQVDVWNTASGATFSEARISGLPDSWWQSSVFSVITGGGFQGPPP